MANPLPVAPIKHSIFQVPKAELHLHIEGTLEPELMFEIARRNKIVLRFKTIESVRRAYRFKNLQQFLDIYYEGCRMLIHERDFFDLTWAYLCRAAKDGVRHVEMFFDPQSHTSRGVAIETVINGIRQATEKAEKVLGITTHLILCFLRHLTADEAMRTLEEVLPFKHWIKAVGLDSSEVGHPPKKFEKVFAFARQHGLLTVAHAGEEGPAEYIWQALELLKVSRVDHGVRCVDDPMLVNQLASRRTPLTMCPLSGLNLRVVNSLKHFPLKTLLHQGLCVTVNSDDPAYFGGYVGDNFRASARALSLSVNDIRQLALNSFEASFLSDSRRAKLMGEVHQFIDHHSDLTPKSETMSTRQL